MTMKKTILCIDDEQSVSIHKLMLETRGYRVLSCNTAVAALEVFQNGGADMVLSNVQLADGTAVRMVEDIRAIRPEVPIILLSARAFHTDAPVNLLLRKGSYTPAELLERIRVLLVKQRGPRRALPVQDSSSKAC